MSECPAARRRIPSSTFCALPWVHVATTVDGVWGRCCFDRTNDYDYYYQQPERPSLRLAEDAVGCLPGSQYEVDNPGQALNVSEVLNSPAMRTTRLEMLAGKEPNACTHCYWVESLGGESHRQSMNSFFSRRLDLSQLVARTNSDGRVDWGPFSIDLRLGNTCNLTCVMCSFPISSRFGPELRSTWSVAHIDPYRDNAKFWQELEQLDTLGFIYLAGGEPFLQPAHMRLIRSLIDSGRAPNIDLHYNSNLTVLPKDAIGSFDHFRRVVVAASCDGVGNTFERIRRGAKWETFLTNLRLIKVAAETWLDVSVQLYNVMELDRIIGLGREEDVRVRVENVVYYPKSLSILAISGDDRKKAVDYLSRLSTEAADHNELALQRELLSLVRTLSRVG
jgi:radical SAM family protein